MKYFHHLCTIIKGFILELKTTRLDYKNYYLKELLFF